MAERRAHPLLELTRARLLEFLREPEAVFWVFVFPVLLAVALGVAFREQPAAAVPVAVTGGPEAAAVLAARLEGVATLRVRRLDEAAARRALHAGEVDVVVAPDPGSPPGPTGQVVYRFDPTRPEGWQARLLLDDALQRALGRQDLLPSRDEHVHEPGGRYIDYLIPGLVGLNLMGSGMWGLGFAIVQARTRKLLKRFAATPMRRSHFLLSFALSRLLLLVGEVVVLVGFGWLLFGVAVRGSLVALAAVVLLGAATFAGLGLAVAARARTIEGVSGWMNLVQLPMWLLSGSFFAYTRFPEVLQPAIRLLPLTAVNDALRAISSRGASLGQCALELLVMAGWTFASFALALKTFRWQ